MSLLAKMFGGRRPAPPVAVEAAADPVADGDGIPVNHRETGATLHRVSADSLTGADLSGANLKGANLAALDLRGTLFNGATLSGATLAGSDLRGSSLVGATLMGADLSYADLRGANLRAATLTGCLANGARYDRDTRWPADLSQEISGLEFCELELAESPSVPDSAPSATQVAVAA